MTEWTKVDKNDQYGLNKNKWTKQDQGGPNRNKWNLSE